MRLARKMAYLFEKPFPKIPVPDVNGHLVDTSNDSPEMLMLRQLQSQIASQGDQLTRSIMDVEVRITQVEKNLKK